MCDDELKHVLDKVFDTLIERGNLYKNYAHIGFGVRSLTVTKDKNGVKWRYFRC
jgi:uncharacterized glyoxalase superfamily protein PhnB